MPLAHFTNIHTAMYYDDPIYKNLFEMQFSDFPDSEYLGKYLTENCYKVNDKYCNFNINEINGEVLVLKIIDKLIRNKTKFNAEVLVHNKEGKVVKIIALEGFRFTKFKNIINYSYNKQDILKPKVHYKYDKINLYFNAKQYQRKKKLQKINVVSTFSH